MGFGRGRLDQAGQFPHSQGIALDLHLSTVYLGLQQHDAGVHYMRKSRHKMAPQHGYLTIYELPSSPLSLLIELRSFFAPRIRLGPLAF